MARPTLILVQLRQFLDTRTSSTLKPDENVPIVEKFQYLPITDAMLKELIPIAADREERMKKLLEITFPLYKKMVYDTKNRMGPTLVSTLPITFAACEMQIISIKHGCISFTVVSAAPLVTHPSQIAKSTLLISTPCSVDIILTISEQLSRIPSCIRIMQKLRDELELYREHAKIEMSKPVLNRKDLWTFWTFNA